MWDLIKFKSFFTEKKTISKVKKKKKTRMGENETIDKGFSFQNV